MPGAAAVRIVVDGAVTVVGEVAQIDDVILDAARPPRPATGMLSAERRRKNSGKIVTTLMTERRSVALSPSRRARSASVIEQSVGGSMRMTRASRSTLVTMRSYGIMHRPRARACTSSVSPCGSS